MRAQLTAETAARAATVKTPASIVGTPKRDMLFVSHANPEDNAFTRWLALRLAREGYPVWCDLTKLLGGEDFWRDIETAIRQRAMKVLFVLSKASNQKAGTLKEIAVAEKVGKAFKDFIIPLRIDDLRSDDVTIELNRLNYVDFSRGWAAGYRKLLEKLEEDVVPKDGRFSPDTVTQWWRTNYPAAEGVLTKTDVHASNWFEFIQLPEVLWLHSIAPKELFEKAPLTLPVPAYHYEHYLLSFAAADEIRSALAEKGLEIANSVELDASQFQQEGMEHPKIERRDARNMVSAIFREGFERFALSRGLLSYELANKAQYYWFKKDLVENDKVFFRSPNGERNWRAMVGFKTLHAKEGSTRIRNWHFGIQAKTYFWPFTGLAVRPHVAFTENGVLYESKAKQHSARRSQCKGWYNDDWLDRMLAAMSFLAGEDSEKIQIPLSASSSLFVSRLPIRFESPVSYEITEQQDEDAETGDADDLDEVGVSEDEEEE